MKSYLGERHLMPFLLVVAALAVIAALTFSLSRILVAVSPAQAALLAIVMAGVTLLGAGFMASAGTTTRGQIAAVSLTVVSLLAVGITAGAVVGERPLEEHGAGGEHGEEIPPFEGPVDVGDNFFEPVEVTVAAGTVVDWHQSGTQPHSVTSDTGLFNSHPDCDFSSTDACMLKDDTYEYTFDAPGRYPYYCIIHGSPGGVGMAGTVIVR